jgi:hypothetical protein
MGSVNPDKSLTHHDGAIMPRYVRGAAIPERRNRFPVVGGLPRPSVEIIYITMQEKHTSKQEKP